MFNSLSYKISKKTNIRIYCNYQSLSRSSFIKSRRFYDKIFESSRLTWESTAQTDSNVAWLALQRGIMP